MWKILVGTKIPANILFSLHTFQNLVCLEVKQKTEENFNFKTNSEKLNDDPGDHVVEGSDVPGQVIHHPPAETVPTRERILSITATEEATAWRRRIWCLLNFWKKIRPFGRRKEEIYVVR